MIRIRVTARLLTGLPTAAGARVDGVPVRSVATP